MGTLRVEDLQTETATESVKGNRFQLTNSTTYENVVFRGTNE